MIEDDTLSECDELISENGTFIKKCNTLFKVYDIEMRAIAEDFEFRIDPDSFEIDMFYEELCPYLDGYFQWNLRTSYSFREYFKNGEVKQCFPTLVWPDDADDDVILADGIHYKDAVKVLNAIGIESNNKNVCDLCYSVGTRHNDRLVILFKLYEEAKKWAQNDNFKTHEFDEDEALEKIFGEK